MSPEILADFFLSLYGVAVMAALFLGWTCRKTFVKARKRLIVAWKPLKWSAGLCAAGIWFMSPEYLYIIMTRLGVLLALLWYGWLWRRRYRRAKGKQRAIYYLPEGTNYAHRERLEGQTRKRSPDQSTHHARDWETSTSPPVETETCHE